MNKKTKLSEFQPYVNVNQLVYEEVYECELLDISSLEICIAQIKKDHPEYKFNYKIETKGSKCFIKFERMGKAEKQVGIYPSIPLIFPMTTYPTQGVLVSSFPALTTKDISAKSF